MRRENLINDGYKINKIETKLSIMLMILIVPYYTLIKGCQYIFKNKITLSKKVKVKKYRADKRYSNPYDERLFKGVFDETLYEKVLATKEEKLKYLVTGLIMVILSILYGVLLIKVI